MTDEIKFSYNWNKKLDCKCFTTIRIKNSKYKLGKSYKIYLNNSYLFDATIKDIQYRTVQTFTEHECRLDTGYSKRETIEIIKKMYKVNAEKLTYMLILLENNKKYEPETEQAKIL